MAGLVIHPPIPKILKKIVDCFPENKPVGL